MRKRMGTGANERGKKSFTPRSASSRQRLSAEETPTGISLVSRPFQVGSSRPTLLAALLRLSGDAAIVLSSLEPYVPGLGFV